MQPDPQDPQYLARRANLDRANALRHARTAFRRDLRTIRKPAAARAALAVLLIGWADGEPRPDCLAGKLTVFHLLQFPVWMGAAKAIVILKRADVGLARPVMDLTVREMRSLADELYAYGDEDLRWEQRLRETA